MSSVLLYPVGALAAFVIVLTGTRLDPVTLERFGRTKGSTVESIRLAIQDLNGGPVSALEMALVAGLLVVVLPALLWYLMSGRPRRVLLLLFWFVHPKVTAAATSHPALGAVQFILLLAMQTIGLWAPMPLALALVWAPPR